VRKAEKRKCGECGGNNHWEKRCPSVKLWREGWGLKQGWHEGEERAIRRGALVERYEWGWVEQEQVVTIVKCVDCGVPGTRPWGDPLEGIMTRITFGTTDAQNARKDGKRRCGM